jgi:hypothetical protein
VRGDQAHAAGAARRGRGRPPPPRRVIRDLIDDEDPSSLLAAELTRVRAAASRGPRRRRLPLPAAGARGRSCGTLYTELADGQGGAPRGRARELTGGAGRRSRSQGEGRRSSGRRSWWAKPVRSGML